MGLKLFELCSNHELHTPAGTTTQACYSTVSQINQLYYLLFMIWLICFLQLMCALMLFLTIFQSYHQCLVVTGSSLLTFIVLPPAEEIRSVFDDI